MSASRRTLVAQAQPLLPFLLSVLGLKRAVAKRLLKYGAVQVNGVAVRQFDHPLSVGQEVALQSLQAVAAESKLQQARIQTIYEDDALIVVNKPAGLLTVANDRESVDTLFVRLNEYLRGRDAKRAARAYVVHRLDEDTSGLVLFAKSESVKHLLQEMWPSVEKTYRAVVQGKPAEDRGTIVSYLTEDEKSRKVYSSPAEKPDSKQAITHYRVLQSRGGRSLVEVKLETGRKHQIRVHLADLGCPVVGDRRYGKGAYRTRLALHAQELRLLHPSTGQTLVCRAATPAAMRRLLAKSKGTT